MEAAKMRLEWRRVFVVVVATAVAAMRRILAAVRRRRRLSWNRGAAVTA